MTKTEYAPTLVGKTVLVTGAASGIGFSVAEQALRGGADVVICDRDPRKVDQARERAGHGAHGIVADVTCESACKQAVCGTVKRFGKVDVLVNSAGIFEKLAATANQTLADWRTVIDVNLQGTFLMAREAAHAMVATGSGGAIVNVASVAGLVGFRASNAYGVSKAAVVMLTQTLATDLASRRIRVNAVAPGFVHTPMTAELPDEIGVPKSTFERRIPMGRFGEPDEIAKAVIFLASDWASYITGAVVPVDGGWCAFGGPGDASISRQT